jgi:hypothetical protein
MMLKNDEQYAIMFFLCMTICLHGDPFFGVAGLYIITNIFYALVWHTTDYIQQFDLPGLFIPQCINWFDPDGSLGWHQSCQCARAYQHNQRSHRNMKINARISDGCAVSS